MAILKSSGKILRSGLSLLISSALVLPPPPPPPAGNVSITDDAVWCWFSDPRAVYYNGKTYIGFFTSTGLNQIVAFTHATDEVSSPVTIRDMVTVDDHANLSLLVRDSDKRLMAFYSAHNGSGLYFKVSVNPEDESAWGAETNLDSVLGVQQYTYTMPVQLTGETNDPIYLFYRYFVSGQPRLGYTWSTNGGSTWSGHHAFYFISGKYVYMKLAQNGDSRIDFFVTNGFPGTDKSSLYHVYYSAGSWYKSDGTAIAAPFYSDAGNFTQVYDGSSTPGWIEDIAIDGSGNPVVLYTVYNSSSDRDYYWARWTGAAWDSHKVADAGANISSRDFEYVGGASLDPADTNVVYASVTVGGQWEIVKYVTADGGVTWTPTAITENSAVENIRPFVPENRQDDLRVMWLYGTYVNYNSFNMGMLGSSE